MPESKLDKQINKAKRALKRADRPGANPEVVAILKDHLAELNLRKGINKASHDV